MEYLRNLFLGLLVPFRFQSTSRTGSKCHSLQTRFRTSWRTLFRSQIIYVKTFLANSREGKVMHEFNLTIELTIIEHEDPTNIGIRKTQFMPDDPSSKGVGFTTLSSYWTFSIFSSEISFFEKRHCNTSYLFLFVTVGTPESPIHLCPYGMEVFCERKSQRCWVICYLSFIRLQSNVT